MSGVLIVTEGSRGIGATVSRLGAERGYAVCVNYVGQAARAAEAVRGIQSKGGAAIAVQAFVSREDDVARLFQTVDREFGRVTALVNNAGVGPGLGSLEDIDPRDIRRALEVNVIGVHLCARRPSDMTRRHGGAGGAIVNVSSAAARVGSPEAFVHYAASKGAVDVLTIGLGKETMPEGIRVKAVRPGVTDTEMLRGGPGFPTEPGNDEWLAGMLKTLPIRRVARPEEVAELIMWLLSDDASYVTGASADVSGGRATP
jgi:NAD(P)-dependent dehydrogenase (short-subunit alcohol dehydrogenase family)